MKKGFVCQMPYVVTLEALSIETSDDQLKTIWE